MKYKEKQRTPGRVSGLWVLVNLWKPLEYCASVIYTQVSWWTDSFTVSLLAWIAVHLFESARTVLGALLFTPPASGKGTPLSSLHRHHDRAEGKRGFDKDHSVSVTNKHARKYYVFWQLHSELLLNNHQDQKGCEVSLQTNNWQNNITLINVVKWK